MRLTMTLTEGSKSQLLRKDVTTALSSDAKSRRGAPTNRGKPSGVVHTIAIPVQPEWSTKSETYSSQPKENTTNNSWERFDDKTNGASYYWGRSGWNSVGNRQHDISYPTSTTAASSSSYLSTLNGNNQRRSSSISAEPPYRIVQSGYSPNRFPLTVPSFNNLNGSSMSSSSSSNTPSSGTYLTHLAISTDVSTPNDTRNYNGNPASGVSKNHNINNDSINNNSNNKCNTVSGNDTVVGAGKKRIIIGSSNISVLRCSPASSPPTISDASLAYFGRGTSHPVGNASRDRSKDITKHSSTSLWSTSGVSRSPNIIGPQFEYPGQTMIPRAKLYFGRPRNVESEVTNVLGRDISPLSLYQNEKNGGGTGNNNNDDGNDDDDNRMRRVKKRGFYDVLWNVPKHENLSSMKNKSVNLSGMENVWTASSGYIGDIERERPTMNIVSDQKATYDGASKQNNSRRKPRIPRFLHSFCCCVWPSSQLREDRKTGGRCATVTTIPEDLITQVKQTSSINGVCAESASGNESYTVDDADAQDVTSGTPFGDKLLPPACPGDMQKNCLIIDLDETLVHSSFKPVKNPDFVIPVEIDNVVHQVYVLKRPFVDDFLDFVGDKFECVLFTASLAKYADPVADLLDKRKIFRCRLFREACVFNKGNYVKDLSRLGRDLKRVIIVDNSPASYAFHDKNAISVPSWFDDMEDTELMEIIPLLERLVTAENVYPILQNCNDELRRSCSPDGISENSRSSS